MTSIDPHQHTADATERDLWQALATAINDLEAWGLLPLGATRTIDAGDAIHGGAVRGHGGYLIRYQAPFTPDPDQPGEDLPFGWQVAPRTT